MEILDGERFEAWKFDDSFLGRKLLVQLPNGGVVDSLISQYELSSDMSMKIKLGLSRSDLSSLLKIGKGV